MSPLEEQRLPVILLATVVSLVLLIGWALNTALVPWHLHLRLDPLAFAILGCFLRRIPFILAALLLGGLVDTIGGAPWSLTAIGVLLGYQAQAFLDPPRTAPPDPLTLFRRTLWLLVPTLLVHHLHGAATTGLWTWLPTALSLEAALSLAATAMLLLPIDRALLALSRIQEQDVR